MAAAISRTVYKPDNGVKWGAFLPMLLVGLAGTLAMGFLLTLLQRIGLYFIIIVPLLLAGATGLIMGGVVKAGHCRNQAIAGLVGVICGLLFYVSYFYFGMVQAGIPASRIDMLPKYVQYTWVYSKTERAGANIHLFGGKTAERFSPDKYNTTGNKVLTVIELLLSVVICFALTLGTACTPYCTALERWFSSKSFKYPPGVGKYFANGISVEAMQQLVAPRRW